MSGSLLFFRDDCCKFGLCAAYWRQFELYKCSQFGCFQSRANLWIVEFELEGMKKNFEVVRNNLATSKFLEASQWSDLAVQMAPKRWGPQKSLKTLESQHFDERRSPLFSGLVEILIFWTCQECFPKSAWKFPNGQKWSGMPPNAFQMAPK